jgi:adenylosuccinate lyase
MADLALNASAQLIDKSIDKLNQSASKIARGDINPAEIARTHIEASRETELATKIAQVAQEVSEEIIEIASDADERKGRALDHFS